MEKNKRNFYFRSQSYNKEAVEVYVGQSSGKQLNEDISNAKKEILIISPYIDETKLDELITLKNKGINVRLAFSDLRNEQKSNILRKLIHQQKDVNEKLKEKVNKNRNIFSLLSTSTLVIGIVLLLFLMLTFEDLNTRNIITFTIGIGCFFVFYKLYRKKQKIEKTPVYRYEYFEKINFKFLRNNFQSDKKMFIHSKIYVIDRKIAYLGSLNFTNNGFTSNFETRIRITQSEKINDLVEFIHNIFDDNHNFKSHEIWFLGKQVYSEEKY